jgi:hypothetical protein
MKKILLSGFFAITSLLTFAQCEIAGGSTTQIGTIVNGDSTTYIFDLTFNLADNGGNKYFNLDMWLSADYPAALSNGALKPTCAQLATSLVNISVNNDVTNPAQPTILSTFDGAVCVPAVDVATTADGLTIEKFYNPGGSVPAGYDTYVIHNISVKILTATSTSVNFFIWSTQSSSQAVAHCSYGPVSLQPTGGPLPVTISAFNAVRNNNNVSLVWETIGEHNAKGFEVQRKSGNGNWQTVAFVNTKAPGGQSSLTLNYTYTETNSSKGATFYRLRQVDFDSHGRYSEIRSVRGDGQSGKTIVYPNPSVDGKVNVLFDGLNAKRSILLVDMNGRTIQHWNNFTANSLHIENLTTGFYRLQINNIETGEQSVHKVVIAK